MSDRRSEWRARRGVGIDVNELAVLGRVSEGVDAVLLHA